MLNELRTVFYSEKIVVVSSFLYMLDLVAKLVVEKGYGSCCRIDGTVPSDKRQSIVDTFNRSGNNKYNVCLLSAKAGGVGLNL